MGKTTTTIAILIIAILLVIAFFKLVDWLLKGGSKKTEKKSEVKKEVQKAEKVVDESIKEKPQPKMEIYNSELADDLIEILKNSQTDISLRGKIEDHMKKESNIAKYIKSKNYRSFEFDSASDQHEDSDSDKPLSFTLDDYKRIMALSNIDDKK